MQYSHTERNMRNNECKLNKLPYDAEFLNALAELEMRIIEDYNAFSSGGSNDIMKAEFADNINYAPGRKFLKITTKSSVWGFINLSHPKFEEGDLLKAASWKTPALNRPRGNIFNNDYVINWTGPKYISGYCAGGPRNGGLL